MLKSPIKSVRVVIGEGATQTAHDLPKLAHNSVTGLNNFHKWRDNVLDVLPAKFPGPAAHLCRDGKLTYTELPPKPAKNIPRLNRTGEQVLDESGNVIMIPNETYKIEVSEYNRKSARAEEETKKSIDQAAGIWLFFKSIISQSSIDKLSELEEWSDIEKMKDIERLWKAIVQTHLDKVESDPVLQLMSALNVLINLRMYPGEDLNVFKRRADEALERVNTANPDKLSELLPMMLVQVFLRNLDERFTDYKCSVLNGIKRNKDQWPTSITRVMTDARNHIVGRSGPKTAAPEINQSGSVLVSADEYDPVTGEAFYSNDNTGSPEEPAVNERKPPRTGCHHCGGQHWKDQCPKLAREQSATRTGPPETGRANARGRGGRGRGRPGRGRGRGDVSGEILLAEQAEHMHLYAPSFDGKGDVIEPAEYAHEERLFMVQEAVSEEPSTRARDIRDHSPDNDFSHNLNDDLSGGAPGNDTVMMTTASKQHDAKRNRIILDTGATRSIFCNHEFLSNIRSVKAKSFVGLAGSIIIDKVGTLSGVGEIYYSPLAPGNILSHSELINTPGCDLDYDKAHPQHRWTLRVHGRVLYTFDLRAHGLWECEPDENNLELAFVSEMSPGPSTVAQNKSKYCLRDLRGAQLAYDAVEQLGYASFGTLETILRHGTISEPPFSLADVTRARDIWGQHVGAVQGKTTHRKSKHVPSQPVDTIAAEHIHQILVGDIMHMQGGMYAVTSAIPMGYIQISHIPDKRIASLQTALEAHISTFTERGCKVAELRFDGEKSVTALRGKLPYSKAEEIRRDLRGHFNGFQAVLVEIAASGAHQPVIERDQRTIKERARCYMSNLPWSVPPSVKPYLLLYVVSRLNLHPDASFADKLCPFERLYGRRPDWKSDVNCKFGQYAHAHEYRQHTNTMQPRTLPVICLLPVGTRSGGTWVLHLSTWKAVKRNQIAVLPMPDDVIALLNSRATNEAANLDTSPLDHDDEADLASPVEPTIAQEPSEDLPVDLVRAENTPIKSVSHAIEVELPDMRPVFDGEDQPPRSTTTPAREHSAPHLYSPVQGQDQRVSPMQSHINSLEQGQRVSLSPMQSHINSPEQGQRVSLSPTHSRRSERDVSPKQSGASYKTPEYIQRYRSQHEGTMSASSDYANGVTPKTISNAEIESRGLHDLDFNLEDIYPSQPDIEHTQESTIADQPATRVFRHPRNAQQKSYKDGNANMRALLTKDADAERVEFCNNISAKKSLVLYGDRAKQVMITELKQMIDLNVFTPVDWNILDTNEKKATIRSMIFLKEKFKADGTFDKLKARLVAGGNMQIRDLYQPDDTSSPTVRTSSVFIVAAIAAFQKREVVTVDIAGAYLNADMKDKVRMILDPLMASILCELQPDYMKYLRHDGTLVVLLNKALYGCIESAKLWYNNLSTTLVKAGFVKNTKDHCVFCKTVRGKQLTVCFHVDDLMITSEDSQAVEEFLVYLKQVYKTITVNRGPVQNYIGMTFTFDPANTVVISMDGYVNDIIKSYDVQKRAQSPATADLFDVNDDSKPLSKSDKETFHSRVAKLLYLAKRSRPDILLAISFLTTRVQSPNVKDMEKLDRVLAYLLETRDLTLTLGIRGVVQLQSYIDASFAPHRDGKSHTGAIWSLGIGTFYAGSSKQKIVTKSSWEAELVAFSDQMSEVLGVQQFLADLGFQITPVIHQDNTSTILSTANGSGASNRTRHVNIRYFWTTQYIDDGTVTVEYTPTGEMIADILTKPLQGELFRRLRALLLGD